MDIDYIAVYDRPSNLFGKVDILKIRIDLQLYKRKIDTGFRQLLTYSSISL